MDRVESKVRVGRGRPRSEECREAILDATADMLEEAPYTKLTIEGIAARAGVSKQTIYKWWKSRAMLAMQAYVRRQTQRVPTPNTGSVRTDLQQVVRRFCRLLRGRRYRETTGGFLAAGQSDPELATEFRETFIGGRRQVVIEIIERGIGHGELRADTDIGMLIDSIYGPIWHRLLIWKAPLDDDFANRIVDHALAAVMPSARLAD